MFKKYSGAELGFEVILLNCVMTLIVTGHKSCSGNADLMKSIQYKLKLVEDNDGKSDCTVRVPDKVAFMAKNSDSIVNLPGKSVVVYNTAVTNLGNGYDNSTGIFTAPSNGVYIFSWTVLAMQGNYFHSYLDLNGNLIARNFADAGIGDHISGSQNVVLEMKKDDKVSVRIHATHRGQYMYGDSWSAFSGYKL
ncbi:C1QL [Mytilus coruscus]|uniref:C1QL n=1 Tax=Mytilus coruscus TaxID=42192 RepID=A0A6J8EQV8_MYTCO|nr:C1QL [Mytilus coruscus]